jgi:hypothetical protein
MSVIYGPSNSSSRFISIWTSISWSEPML